MASAVLDAVGERYNGLAKKSTCLSCGGAVNHASVQAGERCVDLGSGRGRDVVKMAQKAGPDGFVWGIDISDMMRSEALSHAKESNVGNVAFLYGELESLPLPGASADVVVSNCVLNHASDKQAVWNEIFRVLRPGGRFVVSDIYSTEPVPQQYKNDPHAVAECWGGADTRAVYFETVTAAGFPRVEILEESDPYDKGSIQVSSITLRGTKPLY